MLAAGYVDVLLAQHVRGREITDYFLSISKEDRIASNSVEPLAKALESFVRMYEHHAAIEDTVVFPAWKIAVGTNELDALGEKFEEIEHEQFGSDGFESALKRMEEIEESLGLSNLDMFTAPAPPTRQLEFNPNIETTMRYPSKRTEGRTCSQGASNLNL